MNATQHSPGITFAVDDVTPGTHLLPECRMHEALRAHLDSPIESCSDYHATVVERVGYHSLLAAVYTAFSRHLPLVLTPEAVWITIAQGVAHHMATCGESLRSRFVAHEGKLDLVFEFEDWVEGSPENPWPEAFADWTNQIREHVGSELYQTLICDFSTTTAVDIAASQIVMMDIFERYFHYVAVCACGIPQITLAGTPGDWERLAVKVRALRVFDMDWWLDHLEPICDQFARASRGDIDLTHWQAICKLRSAYGGDIINGWVAKLFPYLRAFYRGPCNRRNEIFDTGEGFSTFSAPGGLSHVPLVWTVPNTGRTRRMEAIGGIMGMAQDSATLALRPVIGWAVREASALDVLLARLAKEHRTSPPQAIEFDHLPPDLAAFYHATGDADLFVSDAGPAFRILPFARANGLDFGAEPEFLYAPGDRSWHRLVELPDGDCLAINLNVNRRDPRPDTEYEYDFSPICYCPRGTAHAPGQNSVVAVSFAELLQRLLDGQGKPFWRLPEFRDYGDAELYTCAKRHKRR